MKTVLLLVSGIGILVLFIVSIVLSLDKNASGFFKYLLAYLLFLGVVGLLFFLFGGAYIWIGLLAGVGWMILAIKGAGYRHRDGESADNKRSD